MKTQEFTYRGMVIEFWREPVSYFGAVPAFRIRSLGIDEDGELCGGDVLMKKFVADGCNERAALELARGIVDAYNAVRKDYELVYRGRLIRLHRMKDGTWLYTIFEAPRCQRPLDRGARRLLVGGVYGGYSAVEARKNAEAKIRTWSKK